MLVFLLFAVPLAYAYVLLLRDDAGEPSSLTSISFLRGVGGYLLILIVLLLMRRFVVQPYSGVGGYLYATIFDYFVPLIGAFGLYHWFTPDVRGTATPDRELSLVSFLAGALSLAGFIDLLIRSEYMGTYELFLLPATRIGAMLLLPALYVLFCDETFWIRYLYLAALLLSPALFGTVFILHVLNLNLASIGAALLLFAGGAAVALFGSSRGASVSLR